MANGKKGNEPPRQKGGGIDSGNLVGPRRPYIKPETQIKAGKTEQGHSEKLRKAVLEAESNNRKFSYERATILDQDGNVVIDKSGSKHKVTFSPFEVVRMKDTILTHNHPNESKSHWWGAIGSPFSREDVLAAAQIDLAEIRAVTPTYTFSLKRPEKGWGDVYAIKARYAALSKKYTQKGKSYVAGAKSMKESSERYDREQLSRWHFIVRDLAKEFGWSYTKKKG